MDAKLAYLISLGIIGFGILSILLGIKSNSATPLLWIALGGLTVVVGLISLVVEVRNRTY
jgi:uncharacterized membrane protein HdeD (DUF308 family)